MQFCAIKQKEDKLFMTPLVLDQKYSFLLLISAALCACKF